MEATKAGDLELAFGVAQDDLMRDRVEKLAASDGSGAASRGLLEVPLAAMNHIFQIRDGSRTTGSPTAFFGQDGAQLLPAGRIVHIRRLRFAVQRVLEGKPNVGWFIFLLRRLVPHRVLKASTFRWRVIYSIDWWERYEEVNLL